MPRLLYQCISIEATIHPVGVSVLQKVENDVKSKFGGGRGNKALKHYTPD